MTDIYEFQQETGQYSEYNQYVEQQKEYLKSLIAQGGQTLGEGTPLFIDTFKNVKGLFQTGNKLVGQLSTLKQDTEKAFEKSLEKISKVGEDTATKLTSTVQKGGEKAATVVKDLVEHSKQTGEELVKGVVRKSRILKDRIKGLTDESKDSLNKLQDRFTELKEKVQDRVQKGFSIDTDPEIQKLKEEGNTISSKVSDLLNMDEKQATKMLRSSTVGKFLEEHKSMPKLEEASKSEEMPKLEEVSKLEELPKATQQAKSVLQSRTSYFRNQYDRMLEKRTQSKFEQELDRDPEDLDTRISFISERDKVVEDAKKVYNPISKQYESAKVKVSQATQEAKTKAEDLTQQAKTKAEDLTQQAKTKVNVELEKVGHEIGEQKQQFEQAGKQMIQKGEQVAKEGLKEVGSTAENIMSKGVEAGKSIASKAGESASQLGKIGSEVAETVGKSAEEAASGIGSAVLEGLGPVGEAVGTAMLLYQGIKDIFSGSHAAPPPTMAAPIFTPNI